MFLVRHITLWCRTLPGDPAARLAYAAHLADAGRHRQAVHHLARAASSGLPAAQGRLGRAYLLGQGVPPSLTAALCWLTRAAESGETDAQSLLATLAMQGITATAGAGLFVRRHASEHPPDHQMALHWAERAAAGGSAEAQAIMGYLLTAGPLALRDADRGVAFYRQAAEGGSVQGKLGWALALLGDETGRDHARVLLQEAVEAGLAAAHYTLGGIADGAAAGAASLTEAAAHFHTAAALGHAAAQFRYGLALLAGRGVKQDTLNGESWLRRAALGGQPAAAAMVGDLYARRSELPPNYCEAGLWFQRAAEGGHAGAARALGQLYLRGEAVGGDAWTAVHWLRVAAASGEMEAAYDLGLCLARGIGTLRDDAEALRWLRQAAETLPDARYWYARMLAEGRGVAEDAPQARALFLQAAADGNGDAAVAAGEMLFNGRGGPAAQAAAMVLFTRTAEAGHPGARRALELLGVSHEAAE